MARSLPCRLGMAFFALIYLLTALEPAAGPLTLPEALHAAVAASPEGQAADARVAQARARLQQAERWVPENPEVEARLATDRPLSDQGRTEWEVNIRQRVEISGARGARIQAAQAELAAAEADQTAVERAVRSRITQAWVVLASQTRRRALLQAAAAQAQEGAEAAQRRHAAGAIADAELTLVRADAAQAMSEAAEAEGEWQAARIQLSADLGRAVEAVAPWVPPATTPDLPTLLAAAHQQRFDLTAAGQSVEARAAAVDARRLEGWPAPTLGLGFSRTHEGQGPAALVDNQLIFQVSVPLPFSHNGAAEAAEAEGHRREAVATQAALLRDVDTEVTAAQARLVAARARLAPLAALDSALEDTVTLYEKAHAAGRLSIAELLATRERVRRTRLAAWAAEHEVALAWIALEAAVGGPLAPEAP